MTSETTWVLVVDGNVARFFTRLRDGIPLRELTELAVTAEATRRRHGKSTAVHEGTNHGHQAHPAHDTAQNEGERQFLRHVAGRVNLAADENAVAKLVIVAPPRALGILRDHLSPNTKSLVVREIAKDAVRETPAEIDARVAATPD